MRPGLLVGGCGLVVVGLLFASWVAHWFPVALILIGLVAVCLAFVEGEKAAPAAPQAPRPDADEPVDREMALRERIQELERLRADGVLKPAEYKAKRAALIESWGEP